MNARLYDPSLGRFLSADSIIPNPYLSAAYNRYSYVYNNPLKYTDPSGHEPDYAQDNEAADRERERNDRNDSGGNNRSDNGGNSKSDSGSSGGGGFFEAIGDFFSGLFGGDYNAGIDDSARNLTPITGTTAHGVTTQVTIVGRYMSVTSKTIADTHGGVVKQTTVAIGASTAKMAVTVSSVRETTNAMNVDQTTGLGAKANISVSIARVAGSAGKSYGNGYTGDSGDAGYGYGPTKSVSAGMTYTFNHPNIDRVDIGISP